MITFLHSCHFYPDISSDFLVTFTKGIQKDHTLPQMKYYENIHRPSNIVAKEESFRD